MNPKHYEGDPCWTCGSTTRYRKGGHCVACAARRNKRYAQENPNYYAERKRAYKARHPEKCRAHDMASRERHRESYLDYQANYYQTVVKPKREEKKKRMWSFTQVEDKL